MLGGEEVSPTTQAGNLSARCNLGLVIRKPSFAEPGGALHWEKWRFPVENRLFSLDFGACGAHSAQLTVFCIGRCF